MLSYRPQLALVLMAASILLVNRTGYEGLHEKAIWAVVTGPAGAGLLGMGLDSRGWARWLFTLFARSGTWGPGVLQQAQTLHLCTVD